MGIFETASITVPYRHRCEDRAKVIDLDEGVVIAVADGAGGMGAGAEASETVVREIATSASLEHDARAWCGILQQIDQRVNVGESTCVVVACSSNGFVGACVGDSQAWFIADDKLQDLTKDRIRKPLLGSGKAVPVGFSHYLTSGVLLVATDGFCNYVHRDRLMKEILGIDFAVLPLKLVEMVQLPSGDLWDDIGIVACRLRRGRPTESVIASLIWTERWVVRRLQRSNPLDYRRVNLLAADPVSDSSDSTGSG